MTNKSLVEDIDYLRTLAEEGETAPLLGGRFLAWWGAVLAVAYTGQYAIISGMAGLSLGALNWMWLGVIVVGLSGFFLMLSRFRGTKPGGGSVGNRVERQVWKLTGFTLAALYGGLTLKSALGHEIAISGFNWSLVTVLALYTVALSVTGIMAQNRILQMAGYGAMAATAVGALFMDHTEVYLVVAGAMLLTMCLPGVILMRAEPSETV